MEPIRLIAMDMDGTLLSPDHRSISPACQAALRDAQATGIRLALVSGRLPDDAACFTHDLGIETDVLGLNGAALLHGFGGEVELLGTLASATARGVFAMLRATGRVFTMFSGNDILFTRDTITAEEIGHYCGTHFGREDSRCRVHVGMHGAERMIARGVCKFVIIRRDDPRALAALREQLLAAFPDIETSASSDHSLEINALGTNKGSGLRRLADSLGIPMAQVMALGDAGNDLPMLTAAGVGVAMGNAAPEVLAAARYVTASNAEDGVARAIERLALGRA